MRARQCNDHQQQCKIKRRSTLALLSCVNRPPNRHSLLLTTLLLSGPIVKLCHEAVLNVVLAGTRLIVSEAVVQNAEQPLRRRRVGRMRENCTQHHEEARQLVFHRQPPGLDVEAVAQLAFGVGLETLAEQLSLLQLSQQQRSSRQRPSSLPPREPSPPRGPSSSSAPCATGWRCR